MADAVRRLFANKQFKAKEVAASLSGNSVIVKKITLPLMTEQELSESIYWEAEQYIPFDIQDVNLDYEIIDPGTGANTQGTMDVLLVAAKKDKIADYTSVITQAGRTPVVVDVDAFALQNAYEANYGFEPTRWWSPCSTPAPARSTSTSSPARSRSSPAMSRWAATPSPKRCRRS